MKKTVVHTTGTQCCRPVVRRKEDKVGEEGILYPSSLFPGGRYYSRWHPHYWSRSHCVSVANTFSAGPGSPSPLDLTRVGYSYESGPRKLLMI